MAVRAWAGTGRLSTGLWAPGGWVWGGQIRTCVCVEGGGGGNG